MLRHPFFYAEIKKAQRQVRKAQEAAYSARREFSYLNWHRAEVEQDGRDFYYMGEPLVSFPDIPCPDFCPVAAQKAIAAFWAEGFGSNYTLTEGGDAIPYFNNFNGV